MDVSSLEQYYEYKEISGDYEYQLEDIVNIIRYGLYKDMSFGMVEFTFLVLSSIFEIYVEEDITHELGSYQFMQKGGILNIEKGVYDIKEGIWKTYKVYLNNNSIKELIKMETVPIDEFMGVYLKEKMAFVVRKYGEIADEDIGVNSIRHLVHILSFNSEMLDIGTGEFHRLMYFYTGDGYIKHIDELYKVTVKGLEEYRKTKGEVTRLRVSELIYKIKKENEMGKVRVKEYGVRKEYFNKKREEE